MSAENSVKWLKTAVVYEIKTKNNLALIGRMLYNEDR